jgi:hypothetical protein
VLAAWPAIKLNSLKVEGRTILLEKVPARCKKKIPKNRKRCLLKS